MKVSGEMILFWGLVFGLALYGFIKVRPVSTQGQI